MHEYQKTQAYWDDVFEQEKPKIIKEGKTHHDVLDKALDWLMEDTLSVIDFGCGNGNLLGVIAKRQNGNYVGIDQAVNGVCNARKLFRINEFNKGTFIQGSVEKLETFNENYFDAGILSNILDNLKPKDVKRLLIEMHRVVKPGGKVLVKLNAYLKQDLIDQYAMQSVEQDVYLETSGLYLFNKPSVYWEERLEEHFIIKTKAMMTYENYQLENRLFYLINKA